MSEASTIQTDSYRMLGVVSGMYYEDTDFNENKNFPTCTEAMGTNKDLFQHRARARSLRN
jgi:hypothetical protein